MKKNVFYLLIAIITILEVMLFRWTVGIGEPFPFAAGLLFGIAVIYIARMYVEEVIEDERSQKIRENAALSTLQISWIALLVFSLWMIIEGAGSRLHPELRRLGLFGIGLLAVNAGMIIVYILLLFYYRKRYGE